MEMQNQTSECSCLTLLTLLMNLKMVEAGWKYTPTPESDDMATCSYCQLALDGWENSDKPLYVTLIFCNDS